MDFCDKLHNDLSLRMNGTTHKGQYSDVSRSNFKRRQEDESRSDNMKRVCRDPNIMEHINTLLHLRSGFASTRTQRTINGGVSIQDEQTNQEVTDEFISNNCNAKEEHHDSNTPSKSSAAGNCNVSTNSSSENAVPEIVESSGCDFSNSSLPDLEKCCELYIMNFSYVVLRAYLSQCIDSTPNLLPN